MDNEMGGNIIKDKSFAFAIRIVKLYQFLCEVKREFVLSKQLLRSGTAVGAMIREAEHAESKPDFKHKMAIAKKKSTKLFTGWSYSKNQVTLHWSNFKTFIQMQWKSLNYLQVLSNQRRPTLTTNH